MNELLQKHGCSNVFTIPEGLRELMGDISREVLRDQPVKIYEYITNYLSVLIMTREHGILAVKILEDLCDCRPSVSEHLIQLGMEKKEAQALAEIIKEEVENCAMVEGKEKVKEAEILKKILNRTTLDEAATADICLVARNAYKDYWYRKKVLEQGLKFDPKENWEVAANHTLEIYKKTKPSLTELNRATQRIQAAYKGYYVRKKLLGHLKPKKAMKPKVDLLGPPADIAVSREIDLGPVVDIKVKVENVNKMFAAEDAKKLNVGYDPAKTLEFDPTKPDQGTKKKTALFNYDKQVMSVKVTQPKLVSAGKGSPVHSPIRSPMSIVAGSPSAASPSDVLPSIDVDKFKMPIDTNIAISIDPITSTLVKSNTVHRGSAEDIPPPSTFAPTFGSTLVPTVDSSSYVADDAAAYTDDLVDLTAKSGDGNFDATLPDDASKGSHSEISQKEVELFLLHSSQKVLHDADQDVPEDIQAGDDEDLSDGFAFSVPSSIPTSPIDSDLEDIVDISDNQTDSGQEKIKRSSM